MRLGAADYSFLFGDLGDKPVVGDWDGDGEIGLDRESTGFFYFRSTLDTGIASEQFSFGDAGDRFVAGDWGIMMASKRQTSVPLGFEESADRLAIVPFRSGLGAAGGPVFMHRLQGRR